MLDVFVTALVWYKKICCFVVVIIPVYTKAYVAFPAKSIYISLATYHNWLNV
jgi:hypothetical protein